MGCEHRLHLQLRSRDDTRRLHRSNENVLLCRLVWVSLWTAVCREFLRWCSREERSESNKTEKQVILVFMELNKNSKIN